MKSESERITELELQIAHLQHDYDALNEVILHQNQTIDELKRAYQRLDSKLESQQSTPEKRSLEDEKPPHY